VIKFYIRRQITSVVTALGGWRPINSTSHPTGIVTRSASLSDRIPIGSANQLTTINMSIANKHLQSAMCRYHANQYFSPS